MTQSSKQRVLISGAGIAGLTAAFWMHDIGWEVVVIEKADALREGEFIIDFSGTGFDVAIEMGLADAIRSHQTKIDSLLMCDEHGNEKSRISMANFAETLGVGDKHASINRKHLQSLLYDAVKDKVELRFSTSIAAIDERKDAVHVRFENSQEDAFDLVIGADGQHSNVRQLVFGDEVQFSRYLGYYISAFRAGAEYGSAPGVMNMLRCPGRQAGILDTGDGDSLAFMVFADETGNYVPAEKRPELLREKFSDMGGNVPKILEAISDDTYVYMDSTTQIIMPKWHTDRVALIGDAAYCLTLVSGQGASMAMGGARVLAQELAGKETGAIGEGLARYDARLRDFVEDMQVKSQKFAKQFIPSTRFGLWFAAKMMALATIPIAKPLLGKLFSVQSLFEKEAGDFKKS